jgi:hypothetical protein
MNYRNWNWKKIRQNALDGVIVVVGMAVTVVLFAYAMDLMVRTILEAGLRR